MLTAGNDCPSTQKASMEQMLEKLRVMQENAAFLEHQILRMIETADAEPLDEQSADDLAVEQGPGDIAPSSELAEVENEEISAADLDDEIITDSDIDGICRAALMGVSTTQTADDSNSLELPRDGSLMGEVIAFEPEWRSAAEVELPEVEESSAIDAPEASEAPEVEGKTESEEINTSDLSAELDTSSELDDVLTTNETVVERLRLSDADSSLIPARSAKTANAPDTTGIVARIDTWCAEQHAAETNDKSASPQQSSNVIVMQPRRKRSRVKGAAAAIIAYLILACGIAALTLNAPDELLKIAEAAAAF